MVYGGAIGKYKGAPPVALMGCVIDKDAPFNEIAPCRLGLGCV
jgi:hypothetical protein